MTIITDIGQLMIPCSPASMIEAPGVLAKLKEELDASLARGAGLAANQIGIFLQVCILRGSEPIDLVNPVIVHKANLIEFEEERCLSFPGETVTTARFNGIIVMDLLHPTGILLTGMDAVIAQHECSHLSGLTMYDFEIKIPKVNEPCWCDSGKKYKKCHMGKVIRSL